MPGGEVARGAGYDIYDDQQCIQEVANFGLIAVFPGIDQASARAAEQEPTNTNWGMTVNATCTTAP